MMEKKGREDSTDSFSEEVSLGREIHVFVLDDEPLGFYESLKDVYTGLVQFRKLRNGDAAQVELSQIHPDLLIADLEHPGLDGAGLLKFLAHKKAQYPLLLLSGKNTLTLFEGFWRKECPQLKATLVSKPLQAEVFYQHLASTLADLSLRTGPDAPPRASRNPLRRSA